MSEVPWITERDLFEWAAREPLSIKQIGSSSHGNGSPGERDVKVIPLNRTIILNRVRVVDIAGDQGIQLRLHL